MKFYTMLLSTYFIGAVWCSYPETRSSAGRPFRILNNVNAEIADSVTVNVEVWQGGNMLKKFPLEEAEYIEAGVDPKFVVFVKIKFGNGGDQTFKVAPPQDTTIIDLTLTGVTKPTSTTGEKYWYSIELTPFQRKTAVITSLDNNVTAADITRMPGAVYGKPPIKKKEEKETGKPLKAKS